MKHLKSILASIVFAFIATSCSDSEPTIVKPEPTKLEVKNVDNLHAPGTRAGRKYTGVFTKFSFKEGKKVTGDNWDIAFRATEIIVNGGKKGALLEDIERKGSASMALLSGVKFNDVTEVNTDLYQDKADELVIKTGGGNGWYTYDFSNHVIKATPGKIIVIKTIEGNYVKMEIQSYYKDKVVKTSGESQYYTFKYMYNPKKGDKNLK